MSKTKQKGHGELEHLRGEIRKLKSLVRQLRKRNKELEKQAHFFEDVVENAVDEVKSKKNCPTANCNGVLQEHDFVHIIVTKCNKCDYSKKRKPRRG